MLREVVSGAGMLTLALCVSVQAEGPKLAQAQDGPVYVEWPGVREFSGRMIVRPLQAGALGGMDVSGAALQARDAAARNFIESFVVLEYIPQTDEYIIEVPAGESENDVSERLMGSGNFEYAEPDWLVFPISCPNDTRLGSQWHHDTSHLDSCLGWDIHTGTPETGVGICDTGVRTTHEDLLANRLEGYNAVDRRWESNGGQINDINGHGTLTTGCAAGNGNNGKGISGLGWNLSHRMLRVSNSGGGGSSLSTLQHAARTSIEAGDRAANVSYSGVDSSSNLSTATYIKSIGGLLVWAAGNEGRRLTLSQRDADDIIVVGATNRGDGKPSWSNYGPMVDLVAPGDSVFTTCNNSNTCYASASGTSFSSPLTAGLVGLVFSSNPDLTPDEVEAALKAGVDDLGTAGPDDTYGHGRINTNGALGNSGGGGGVCDKIIKHKVRCRANGTLKGTLRFTDSSENGRVITVTIDGTYDVDTTVNADRAKWSLCCFSAGPHTVELKSPSCPDFAKTTTCQ